MPYQGKKIFILVCVTIFFQHTPRIESLKQLTISYLDLNLSLYLNQTLSYEFENTQRTEGDRLMSIEEGHL